MYESYVLLAVLIGVYVLWELYGRTVFEWFTSWSSYFRLAGGILLIAYLWWQFQERPEEFQDTMAFAKEVLTTAGVGSYAATTKEKRNVTGLMKKTVAANQQWKCGHCKTLLNETYEVDHIKALFNGGTNEMSNLVALCPNCHRSKTMKERLAA